jgi:four helix bundle protein
LPHSGLETVEKIACSNVRNQKRPDISCGTNRDYDHGMMIKSFRDLDAWIKGMPLAEQCYRLTATFPVTERYGLTSEIRRSAVSIPSNIAEGHSPRLTRPYADHVSIAMGSGGELETCLEVARRLGFLTQTEAVSAIANCQSECQILTRLHQALERKIGGFDQSDRNQGNGGFRGRR